MRHQVGQRFRYLLTGCNGCNEAKDGEDANSRLNVMSAIHHDSFLDVLERVEPAKRCTTRATT
jgi:hypothetical protein